MLHMIYTMEHYVLVTFNLGILAGVAAVVINILHDKNAKNFLEEILLQNKHKAKDLTTHWTHYASENSPFSNMLSDLSYLQ